MSRTTRIVSTIMLVGLTGCVSTIRDECYNAGAQVCLEVDAHHAWWDYKCNCDPDVCHIHDFGCGFRDGYMNVASGGDGKRPLVAPSKYWSQCYANSVGQAKQVAWFNGYSAGAIYALKSGANSGHHLVLSDCEVPPCSQCAQLQATELHHHSHDTVDELLIEPDEPPVDVPEPETILTPSAPAEQVTPPAPPEPTTTGLPGLIEPEPWRPEERGLEETPPAFEPSAPPEESDDVLGSGLIRPDLRVPRFDPPLATSVSAGAVQTSAPTLHSANPLLPNPAEEPKVDDSPYTLDIRPTTKVTPLRSVDRRLAGASREFQL